MIDPATIYKALKIIAGILTVITGVKNFRLAQIRNQKINLSTRLKKYTNSYYSTSYDKKFVPTLEINPTK